jgi:signal transduction histidine kinase
MAERGIEVTLDLRPAHAVVHADRDRLVQVVVNLLSNAAKFVPDQGGRVLVQLLRQDGGFTLRVEDNGPGVPEAYREAAFEKFRQVGGGLKSKPKGTGLGLTISRTIIERFAGRIWLEGASLGGAAVCFTLPEAQTARAAA